MPPTRRNNGIRKDNSKRNFSPEQSRQLADATMTSVKLKIGHDDKSVEVLPETSLIIPESAQNAVPVKRTVQKPRTKVERQQDMVLEVRMYLQGYSFQEIADVLKDVRPYHITAQAITKDINIILSEWRRTYISDIDTLKAKELEHVNVLEKAYWEGYERSLRDTESITSVQVDDKLASVVPHGKQQPTLTRRRTQIKKEKRDGNPEFLDGIRWCIEQRCKILGINAPQKIAISDWRDEARKAGVKPDVLSDAFNEMVKKAIEAGPSANYVALPPSKLGDL